MGISAATGSAAGSMSASDKTKLDGVATGATANATDAQLRDRATHTGEHPIASVTGLQGALDGKAAAADLTAHTGAATGAHAATAIAFTPGGTIQATNVQAAIAEVAAEATAAAGTADWNTLINKPQNIIYDTTTVAGQIMYRDTTPGNNMATPAMGAVATVYQPGYAAASGAWAIDSNDATEMEMMGANGANVVIDVGQVRTIDQFRVKQYSNFYGANAISIHSSPDNVNWTTRHYIGSRVGDTGVANLTTPATARYWRFYAHGSDVGMWRAQSLQLHTANYYAPLAAKDLGELVQDIVGPFLADSAELDGTYDDATNSCRRRSSQRPWLQAATPTPP